MARADIVTFDPLNGVFANDDTLTVSVVVDDSFADIRGLSFVYEFDPTVVTIIAVEAGALFVNSPCDEFLEWRNEAAAGDSIAVDLAGLGCSVTGPGEVLTFRFTGFTPGIGPIACRSGTIRDSFNERLPFTCVDGTIEYVMAVPIERVTWAAIRQRYETTDRTPVLERRR